MSLTATNTGGYGVSGVSGVKPTNSHRHGGGGGHHRSKLGMAGGPSEMETALVRHVRQAIPLEALKELAGEIGFVQEDVQGVRIHICMFMFAYTCMTIHAY